MEQSYNETNLDKNVHASFITLELKTVTVKCFVMLGSDNTASLGAGVLFTSPTAILTNTGKII